MELGGAGAEPPIRMCGALPRRPAIATFLALAAAAVTSPMLAAAAPARPPASAALTGKTIVLDPGHNGGNARAPAMINRLVPIGKARQRKACDTTGTRPTAATRRRPTRGTSPCARGACCEPRRDGRPDARRQPLGRARASTSARGSPTARAPTRRSRSTPTAARPSGYGFHVIEPALIAGLTDDIFGASHRLALDVRERFRRRPASRTPRTSAAPAWTAAATSAACASSDQPAVFIETGNMRSARDARR